MRRFFPVWFWSIALFGLAHCGADDDQQPAGVLMGGSGGLLPSAPIGGASGGAAANAAAAAQGGGAVPVAGTAGSATPPIGGSTAMQPPDAGHAHDAGAAGSDAVADAGDPDACDRPCLIEVIHGFIDAVVAHDPSTLKLGSALKYTDNGVAQDVGEGLWQSASAVHEDTRLEYADPETGNVASQIVLDEGSTPVMYQVRLKVVAHEITEVESMTVHQSDAANGFFDVANMKPEAMWSQPLAKPTTREALKAEVDLYIEYLDGMHGSSGVHLDSGCARYENGVQTASGAGFALQNWSFDVVPRYLVFDEEYGIAWGMFPFSQAATALVVGEAFKVVDGKIMMIRAVMHNMPAKAWD